jgi:hypothetical protein
LIATIFPKGFKFAKNEIGTENDEMLSRVYLIGS